MQCGIPHFLGNFFKTKDASEYCQSGVKRIQTGTHLHLLHLIHRLAVCKDQAAFFQLRSSVRELILNDKILGFLRIYKGSNVCLSGGDDGLQTFGAVFCQHFLHCRIRAGYDLVDHGPGEGNLLLIPHIGGKTGIRKTIFLPGFHKGHDGFFQPIPIVGTVVHADHGHRLCAGLIPRIQEGCDLSHIADRLLGAIHDIRFHLRSKGAIPLHQTVTFLGDRKGNHLQRIFSENLSETLQVIVVAGVCGQRFRNASDNGFFNGSVCLQCSQKIVIVMGSKQLLHGFMTAHSDQSPVDHTCVQKILHHICLKCTENISGAKMKPEGILFCFFYHSCAVIARELITGSFPLCSVLNQALFI